VEQLQHHQIPYLEMLQTSLPTRQTAAILSAALQFLANPTNTNHLINLYNLFDRQLERSDQKLRKKITQILRSCTYLEQYLYPLPDQDWLSSLEPESTPEFEKVIESLMIFRSTLTQWQKATELPINQLLITIGQDIFTKQSELALTHKLALMLEQSTHNHPEWMLPQFADELELIAQNRRKMFGFDEEDNGFNPEAHKGKVVITTYHKSKGLEWDRVYLLSINNYDFPSALAGDEFMSEKYFYKNPINLEAETLAKLKALLHRDIEGLFMEEGYATQQSRYEYAAERVRLLYVGITRAKQELVLTWNTGDTHFKRQVPLSASIPYKALQAFWEENHEPA
jgi:DNA helicase-2/ATP-dependent DNA helicase PcrA